MITRVDDLEHEVEDKDREIKRLKSKHRADFVDIEDKLEQKVTEVETLKVVIFYSLFLYQREIRKNGYQGTRELTYQPTYFLLPID